MENDSSCGNSEQCAKEQTLSEAIQLVRQIGELVDSELSFAGITLMRLPILST